MGEWLAAPLDTRRVGRPWTHDFHCGRVQALPASTLTSTFAFRPFQDGSIPLEIAAEAGDVALMTTLIKDGAFADEVDKVGACAPGRAPMNGARPVEKPKAETPPVDISAYLHVPTCTQVRVHVQAVHASCSPAATHTYVHAYALAWTLLRPPSSCCTTAPRPPPGARLQFNQ